MADVEKRAEEKKRDCCPREIRDPGPEEPPKWLLMVYMAAAAPNLQEPLSLDLAELSRPLRDLGAAADVVEVVVQIDTPTNVTKRFRLTGGKPVLRYVGGTNVDNTLFCFVTDTVKQTKAKYKALVIWGHASGVGRGFDPDRRLAPTSLDGATRALGPNAQPAPHAGAVWNQLKRLHSDHSLDLVGFDACFMGSVEVACEIRKRVALALAPQADIGLEGWHYDLLLDQIIASRGRIRPRKLGKNVVRQVGLSRSSPEALTLLDLVRVNELITRLRDLTRVLFLSYKHTNREPQFRRTIQDAFHDAMWASVRQFLDLADLCRLLASRVPERLVRSAARRVLNVLTRTRYPLVVDHHCTLEVPLGGLSIYCPWPRATRRMTRYGVRNVQVDECEYKELVLAKRTRTNGKEGWGDFIFDFQAMQDAERRWVRRETRDGIDEFATSLHDARAGDPKPPGRAGDPKPAGRAGDPKPPGRGDVSVFGRGDDLRFMSQGDDPFAF